ncbi:MULTISPECIES: hypothetical protein [unclassified Pseudovibrio]|uniref:hypothetical protein n=1 Tax=unclassified Pseudovibrio TaxID=2627060 RepID=UPI0007AEDC8C|nr:MULTISPECIES: hypothetical protein [unclassified Pseudovibrio]KZL14713.1 hypothetical protein PsAD37_04825 [Pseudovibrio sp. Ad37]KZL21688.1 hypothetical protein PsWM33_04260 [Pseudovibrio sp. WM33]
MPLPTLKTKRFTHEHGLRITVQVPEPSAQNIIDHLCKITSLKYGDYDSVTFKTAGGIQRFRSLGSGRNAATTDAVEVLCIELSFFLENDAALAAQVIEEVYCTHPYEEPVIFVENCLRTLHFRGMDEGNPNRFWNAAPADWVPEEHR